VSSDQSPIILAFSGGLDTSFCVPWLKEHLGRDVITATVDTGGIDSAAAAALEERALALGAIEHVLIDCKEDFFTTVIRHLIAGNVLRGQAYPLCVGAERGLQAARLAQLAIERGATTVAHGCTAAGNDQVRFEVALRTLSPGLEILAPVRDNSWVREEQLAYLEKHKLPLPAQGSAYSINRGLWGITIGGRETLTSENSIAEDAWVLSARAFSEPQAPSRHTLRFEAGIPVALDDTDMPPVELIEALETLAGGYGIGRGIHLGDTVPRRNHIDHGPPGAGKTRAQRAAKPGQGRRCICLRRPRARRQATRPGLRRHRSILQRITTARDRHRQVLACARAPFHRGSIVTVFATGGNPGRLWRIRRRVDRGRCARVRAHPFVARVTAD
jgi:hypothetical protein